MRLTIHPFLHQTQGNLLLIPYWNGAKNLKIALSNIYFDKSFDKNSPLPTLRSLSLADRIKHIAAGFLLMLPLLNIITFCALKALTPQVTALPPPPVPKQPPPLPSFHAAGVLPYLVDEEGTAYVMIGRECPSSKKKAGQWCDFGGRREKGESPIETAAREAWEETVGALGSINKIKSAIQSTPSIGNDRYKLFLMKVDQKVKDLTDQIDHSDKKNAALKEKSHYMWVKVSQLFHVVKNHHVSKNILFNSKGEPLRPSFVKNLHKAYHTPTKRKILETAFGAHNL